MKRRMLGATGLSVPMLGFGAATLGSVFGQVSQETADQAVRAALELGVDLFDTSPLYNDSEFVLGNALSGVPRESYTLCSKVGRYPGGVSDLSAANVARSLDESLRRLGTDYLDIVYCHDIEFVPLAPVIDDALPTLRAAQKAGKVRFVGVSGLPLALYDEVLAHTPLDLVLSYCHGCIHDDTLLGALPNWTERGLGIVNASPLAMGLLTDDGPPAWHPAPAELKDAARSAAELCKSRGVSLAAIALGYSASLPGVDVTLSGISSEEQLRENVQAINAPVDDTLLDNLRAIFAPVRNISWPSGRFPAPSSWID